MLTPEYLDSCADTIIQLYSKLDESITRDIARRICKKGELTYTADWQSQILQESGNLYDEVLEEISIYTDKSKNELKEIFKNSISESMKYDAGIYKLAGKTLSMSQAALQVLTAGYNKTHGNLINLTMTTANTAQTAYINACTLAEMQITSGAFDYNTAIRNAIKSAVTEGTTVLYPSGHHDKLDVAIRRSVMTGVSQTAGQVSLQNAKDMECDLMEITAHSGARPSHAAWQGQIVSLSGRRGYLSLSDIGYGDGAGFKGWNCRHDWFPFFEGISTPNYTQEELDALQAKDTPYNDKMYTEYEATQMQRNMERNIRATRRELAGLDESIKNAPNDEVANRLKEDFQKASAQLKSQEAKLKDFCNQTGLYNEKERCQVYGFGRSTSQKAVHANKKYLSNSSKSVANSSKNGIIVKKRTGKERADEFSKNWRNASLQESIKNFIPNAKKLDIPEKGKIIYFNDDNPIQIVYDINGDYFRIQDTRIQSKRAYLDLDGSNANNKIVDGKQMGRSKSEYQAYTHFKNTDKN